MALSVLFALTSLFWLGLGFTRYFHFFSWVVCKRKLGSLKSARSRDIINRKKNLKYYSEKTGELYSGIQNLEMKSDTYKGSISVKEVNTASESAK